MKYTACFTGHRPQSLPCGFDETHPACLKIKYQLKRLIKGLIDKKNVMHFISGGALGVDMWAMEIVLELKEEYPNITLEAAIPYRSQCVSSDFWVFADSIFIIPLHLFNYFFLVFVDIYNQICYTIYSYIVRKGFIMSISGKVKGLLSLNGKDHAGLAAALGISTQGLSNKLYRDSFSTKDLITVAEYVGCELAFLSTGGSKTVLDKTDIKEKKTKNITSIKTDILEENV